MSNPPSNSKSPQYPQRPPSSQGTPPQPLPSYSAGQMPSTYQTPYPQQSYPQQPTSQWGQQAPQQQSQWGQQQGQQPPSRHTSQWGQQPQQQSQWGQQQGQQPPSRPTSQWGQQAPQQQSQWGQQQAQTPQASQWNFPDASAQSSFWSAPPSQASTPQQGTTARAPQSYAAPGNNPPSLNTTQPIPMPKDPSRPMSLLDFNIPPLPAPQGGPPGWAERKAEQEAKRQEKMLAKMREGEGYEEERSTGWRYLIEVMGESMGALFTVVFVAILFFFALRYIGFDNIISFFVD